MQPQFARFTDQERHLVTKITNRAVEKWPALDAMNLTMDLAATHYQTPLDLEALSVFDDFNFAHDIAGIISHMNRKTGLLNGHFLPRCAR